MRISNKTVFVFAALMLQGTLPVLATQAGRPDSSIMKTAEKYRQAVLAGDASAAASTYREDAIEMAPGRPLLKGRAAIEQYYRELFQGPVKITSFMFSYLETSSMGDTGYVTGTYQQKLTGGPRGILEDSGKFVVIVKRTGGAWGSAYVIYNSDHSLSTPDAASLIVPFPQRDLGILISHHANAACGWLFRLGIVGLAVILLASILMTKTLLAT
jgi:uncharacterized protein (TIGR02246 family)